MLCPSSLILHYSRCGEHCILDSDEKLPYGSDRPVEVDILCSRSCVIDTNRWVAFDKRDDPEFTGSEVGSHRDLDCGKRA